MRDFSIARLRDLKRGHSSKSRNRAIAKSRNLPLSGITVADFSRVLAGPFCTMLLADAGARVIKIEEPGRGDETRRWGPPFVDDQSAYYLSINRNKESITLNMKSREGLKVARELVRRADVVVENFRAVQRKQFGLTPATVKRVNPRAVICSIRGYDDDSADADQPGYDLLAQAGAGLMWITGQPDGAPTKIGVALADVLTAHYAYGSIVTALFARERTGRGTSVDVSLFGATVASLVNVAQNHLVTGEEARRYGNAHPSIVPYQAFAGIDRPFVVGAASDRHYELLCREVLSRADLATDTRFQTNAARVRNRAILVRELEKIFATRPAAEWVESCRRAGIPAEVVAGLKDIFSRNPQLVVKLGKKRLVRNPVRFASKHLRVRSEPPQLGEHTERILSELGFSKADIRDLRAGGAI